MTRAARILVAAADNTSGTALGRALEAAHHRVRLCDGPERAPQQVVAFRPDLVVIDLPHGDGQLVAAVVRRIHVTYRPLLLGLTDGSEQEMAALDAGADACITRPFTTAELEVHVRALLRRVTWVVHTVHQIGGLVVDVGAHIALHDDREVALSTKEFALLEMLIECPGTVVSKRSILERLWGFDAYDENLVEVHVSALRRRLPDGAKRMIQTVRGVGYVLREGQPQDRPA